MITLANLSTPARGAVRGAVTAFGSRADRLMPPLRSALTRGLTVFIFHDITDSPSPFQQANRAYTSPEVFRGQIDWIGTRFRIVAPSLLRRLGGSGALPANAAMITFDDAWAGVFRVGLPILRERGIPGLCFLNMGTVAGDPDLAAVRRYERSGMTADASMPPGPLDAQGGLRVLQKIRDRYGRDAAFRRYQGATATHEDLARAAKAPDVWFANHLFHHWDLRWISEDLLDDSFTRNSAALADYANSVPAFATPHGYAGEGIRDPFSVPAARGARLMFTGTGNQNSDPRAAVLDRLSLPPEPAFAREWWYAVHRRRVLGARTG